jgi:hypothetical protein
MIMRGVSIAAVAVARVRRSFCQSTFDQTSSASPRHDGMAPVTMLRFIKG